MADSVQKLPDICCYNLLIPRKSNPASLYLNKTWWIATKICCNMVATIHPKGTWKWSELFELFASCGFFACWSCNVWWTLPMTLLAATWFERQSCEGIRCLYGDNDRQTFFFGISSFITHLWWRSLCQSILHLEIQDFLASFTSIFHSFGRFVYCD